MCSMVRRSWRLLLPETLRQSRGASGSTGATLQRFLATPTEVRSRWASRASPRSVTASTPAPATYVVEDEPQFPETLQHLRQPRALHPQEGAQVGRRDPGPVRDQVEGALLHGLEQRRQHPLVPAAPSSCREAPRKRAPRQRPLDRPRATRPHVRERLVQPETCRPRRRAPDAGASARRGRIPLKSEEGDEVGPRQEPARMAQPHLVGHEQEGARRLRSLPQPPDALAEARAVRRQALPHDGDRAPVGQRDGGIHGHGPVPAEAEREGDAGERRGEAVDDRHGVETLEEDAPPAPRDGPRAEQLVHAHTLLPGHAPHSLGAEAVAAGGGDELRGVGHGLHQALPLQRGATVL